MRFTPQQLVQSVSSVPSVPAIFTRLTAAIEDPCSSIRDVESIVNEYPALAGRLLRLANSAYFGLPARVDTISRAIALVGSRQVRGLALAASVIDTFRQASPAHVTMESFWRHSIGCGLSARILAGWCRVADTEQYFVAGLLHDIGRLILFLRAASEMSSALSSARGSRRLLFHCEREVLGFDHAAVGGELLKRWNLPAHICAAVEYHHAPQQAGMHRQAAATVHVADILINGIACGSSGERHVPTLDAQAWDLLGLSPRVVAPTLKLLKLQLSETLSAFLDGSP